MRQPLKPWSPSTPRELKPKAQATIDALLKAVRHLDTNNVPNDKRCLFVTPAQKEALRDYMANMPGYNTQNVSSYMERGKFMGVEIRVRPHDD